MFRLLLPSLFRSSRPILAFVVLSALILPTEAEDKKDEKKKEPPRVVVVVPLAVTAGTTNKVRVRGNNLTNTTEVRFLSAPSIDAKIKSTGKADFPKDADVKKFGDTQIELDLWIRADNSLGTNQFVVITPDGQSEPHVVDVVTNGMLIMEKEPNGGFRKPQPIDFGKTVHGLIQEAADVDVFELRSTGSATIEAEIVAARLGSPLDSIVTLYDHNGHILAVNDDGAGSDSLLRAKVNDAGLYLLSVMDAHDRGSAAHVYELKVRLTASTATTSR
jgi:hypothetical protein